MSENRRLYNFGKLAAMGVLGVVGIGLFVFALLWPMLLWWQFNQALSVSIALTVIWIAANI